jgi:hypothetical protein
MRHNADVQTSLGQTVNMYCDESISFQMRGAGTKVSDEDSKMFKKGTLDW